MINGKEFLNSIFYMSATSKYLKVTRTYLMEIHNFHKIIKAKSAVLLKRSFLAYGNQSQYGN